MFYWGYSLSQMNFAFNLFFLSGSRQQRERCKRRQSKKKGKGNDGVAQKRRGTVAVRNDELLEFEHVIVRCLIKLIMIPEVIV